MELNTLLVRKDGTPYISYAATYTVTDADVVRMDDLLRSGKTGAAVLIPWIKGTRANRPGLGLKAAKDVADYLLEELMYGGITVERSPKVTYKGGANKKGRIWEGFDSTFDTALNA